MRCANYHSNCLSHGCLLQHIVTCRTAIPSISPPVDRVSYARKHCTTPTSLAIPSICPTLHVNGTLFEVSSVLHRPHASRSECTTLRLQVRSHWGDVASPNCLHLQPLHSHTLTVAATSPRTCSQCHECSHISPAPLRRPPLLLLLLTVPPQAPAKDPGLLLHSARMQLQQLSPVQMIAPAAIPPHATQN